MKFHTIKTYSVTDHAEALQDLIASKQRRVDLNLGSSANEPQVVYGPIGQLVVKEIEEAPAPIKVGDVYKTRNGKSCRIIVADKKGIFPIIGLADNGDVEIPYTYTSKGTISSNSEHPADLMRPKITRRVVEFIPRDDPINLLPVVHQWDLGNYPGF